MNFQLLNQIGLAIYPIAAVSSQSILDASTVLMFLTTAWLIRKNKDLFVFKRIGIEWAFLGYILIVILGYIFNASADAGWRESLIKFSWLIDIYILIYSIESVRLSTVHIIQILSTLSIGPTIYSLLSYIKGVDLLTGRDNSRITGLVNSSTYHAHGNAFIFVFLIGCLYFSIKKLSKGWKVFSLFSTFLLGLSILLTFTRGIWISIFVSSFVVLLFLDWKTLLKFAFASLIVFGASFQLWSKFQDRVVRSTEANNEQRVSLFKVNVEIWKEYPLLGIGYGENLRRNREYWDRPEWNKPPGYITSHAHNQYLNVAATTGLFGLFFFCSILFFFFKKNFNLIRKTKIEVFPERYALLIVCFWAQLEFALGCITDVSFEYAKIRALILLVWAVVIAIEHKPSVVKEATGV